MKFIVDSFNKQIFILLKSKLSMKNATIHKDINSNHPIKLKTTHLKVPLSNFLTINN